VALKLNDAQATALDKARASESRSAWIRNVIADALDIAIAVTENRKPEPSPGRAVHAPTCKCGVCRPSR